MNKEQDHQEIVGKKISSEMIESIFDFLFLC